MRTVWIMAALLAGTSAASAQEVVLYGAGSLKPVLTALAADYSRATGVKVTTNFGPSGLMREKIEAGDKVDVFGSADMGHALKLKREGRAAQVVMFTRNRLCAFAKPEVGLTQANFVEKLLGDSVKLGTSTPQADPGGDYTWAMFRMMDKAQPGAFAALDAKAQKIVGGATTVDPANPNPVKSGFEKGQINVMMGYCSGADQQRADTPDVQAVPVPDRFSLGPEYGLAIMSLAKPEAVALALAILSPEGQATLAKFGFAPVGAVTAP